MLASFLILSATTTVLAAAESHGISLLAEDCRRPILVVSPSGRDAEDLYGDLAFFMGEKDSPSPFRNRLHLFPSWEILPFEELSPHPFLQLPP